ncbi:hypothetical protein Dvar_39690 [Desulfosarcina variabilis str. Montpellier]
MKTNNIAYTKHSSEKNIIIGIKFNPCGKSFISKCIFHGSINFIFAFVGLEKTSRNILRCFDFISNLIPLFATTFKIVVVNSGKSVILRRVVFDSEAMLKRSIRFTRLLSKWAIALTIENELHREYSV